MSNIRFSQLPTVVSLKDSDIFAISSPDTSTPPVYTSVQSPISQVAAKVVEGTTFTTSLNTTNKTVAGSINETLSNFANDYSTSSAYAVGDCVLYAGSIYQCTTAIPSGEAWDSTHWRQIKAVDVGSGGGEQKFQPVIYSNEEHEIGVWTDGKPLYQKTWDFGQDVEFPTNVWTNTSIAIADWNIEKIIEHQCVNNRGTSWDNTSVNSDQAYVQIFHNRVNAPITIRFLTLFYTKSTDTPGSGTWTPQGVPAVHYSTNEQIVGTWIDGSTVYEKTFVFDNQVEVSSTSWTSTGITADYISGIFGAEMFGVNNYQGGAIANIQNSIIQLQALRNSNAFPKAFTLRYTKSSS